MRQTLSREIIATTARSILETEGLHAVSLRRVAGRLGVTAPALYAHMVDKRDLLQGIVDQESEALLGRLAGLDVRDPVERLEAICCTYVDYGVDNPDMFRAMFLLRPELTGEPRGGSPAVVERILGVLVEAVREAGAQRAIAPCNPELAALTLWTTAHGVVVTLLAGPPLPPHVREGLARAALGTVLAGLRQGSMVGAG